MDGGADSPRCGAAGVQPEGSEPGGGKEARGGGQDGASLAADWEEFSRRELDREGDFMEIPG